MPSVNFIEHDGTEREVDIKIGVSVMQGAVNKLINGIVGECGGCCSCATCHCYVDDAWQERVGAPCDTEKDMLEGAVDPKSNSRLSCQIMMTDELDGLVLHLPESQY